MLRIVNPSMHCRYCQETGFRFLQDRDLPIPILMKCQCHYGSNTITKYIPQWSRELNGVFGDVEFPIKDFNPLRDIQDSQASMMDLIWRKVEEWKYKIQVSENYWKQQILKSREGRP